MKLKNSLYLFWLFIVFFKTVNSQNEYVIFDEVIASNFNFKKEIRLIDSLINLKEDKLSKAKLTHKYFITKYKKRDYNTALKYALKERDIYESLNLINTEYKRSIYSIAYLYQLLYNYNKSIFYYKYYLKFDDIKNKSRAIKYLGQNYFESGDYHNAIYYLKKVINLEEQQQTEKKLFNSYLLLYDIYDIYESKKYSIKKIELLNKADSLFKKNTFSNNFFYRLNNKTAFYYLNSVDYNFNKAKHYYYKNLERSYKENDSLIISSMYTNIGELYNREKKDSALYFFNLSIKFDRSNLHKFYSNKSTYYYKRNNFNQALLDINKAINIELQLDNNLSDYIPEKDELLKFNDLFFLFDIMNKKIEIYINIYKKKIDTKYLNLALKNIKVLDELVNHIKNNNIDDNSNLIWQDLISATYSKAIYCCKILHNYELANYYFEKNKANLILNSTVKRSLQSKISTEIINSELKFNKQINKLKERLESSSKTDKKKIDNQLYKAKLLYDNFTDSVKKKYPYIYDKFDIELLTLKNIQKKLDTNQVILSYISNSKDVEEAIYEFIITKYDSEIIEIPNTKLFNENLDLFKRLISKPFNTKSEKENFKNVSFSLYENFFPSKKIQNLIKNKKIIILPDGKVRNLPFEALITNNNSLDYLINYCSISYGYSMSFLHQNNKVKRNPKNNFLGITPIKFNYDKLSNLKYSEIELKKINKIYAIDKLINKNANKQKFLKLSNEYNIIHLATHAGIDSLYKPWIAFKKNKLLLSELYTIKTQADLVVLSACNTSLGEHHTGEGVFSLARGFFYSGSKTVVSTLWNVNDKSTVTIMSDFYKNLKNGETKSIALNNAKRNYLNNHTSTDASPYYWSSFILIGDANKLTEISNTNLIYFIIVVLIILFWLFKRNHK